MARKFYCKRRNSILALENAASPEAQLEKRKVEQPEGIENGSSQCGRGSYTIEKASETTQV